MLRYLSLISITLLSCPSPRDKASHPAKATDSADKIAPDISCGQILSNLVRSGNAVAFKHFERSIVKAKIDYITTDKARIKLFVPDISDRPGKEQTVGWLEFYKQTGKLMDITGDPGRPLELQYDKTILHGHDLFRLCNSGTAVAKPGTGYEPGDVILEKDIRFNGKVQRFFSLAEFEQFFGKPDSIKLLADEAPCITIFDTGAPDDKYLYKNGSRFETSGNNVAVDEYWFLNGNFITYKGIRIDAGTTMDDMQRLFPTAVKRRLGLDKEGKQWVIKLREDEKGVSDGHIKLFFSNNKVCFMHWWFSC
ncbi:hypothetical protein [Niabella drilacis]|uniref:Uncharacterized protein n=1 Tax=Niabella drilacis (strain DSM 25811 / CCM 8410 / CCUG 62505 / LMG 26954 / E90) TaxID=1285928 RepID=A0A1G6TCR5_NIADE|nr:hypothetical protein [Niabella drilacis]SDD26654.1 hypothetical protein SAMN04487894_107167 [Niabella drilacis]